MTHTTVTFETKGCTFDVVVEGDVTTGGSNSYHSDEPQWTEVEVEGYSNPVTGKPLSKRLVDWIETNHIEYVVDSLAECE